MLPKGQVEAEIRNRREARREAEEEADRSLIERQLEHGVVGFIDKDVSDVGRSVVFGSENPSVGDLAKSAALTAAGGAIGKGLVSAGRAAKAAKGAGAAAPKLEQTAIKGASKLKRAKAKVDARPRPVKAAKAKAAGGVKKAASKAPKPVKSAAKSKPAKAAVKTAKGTRKAYRSKPAAPIRVPLQVAGRHPGKIALASLEGPAAVEFARTGDASKLSAPIEGTARAIIENPRRTAATTGRSFLGLVTAPVGIAQQSGVTAYRAARSEAIPDVLGGGEYEGKEVVAPIKSAVVGSDEQRKQQGGEPAGLVGFAKRYADVYGSGDPEEVQKATEEEFGVGMALPAIGALRGRARRGPPAPEQGLGRVSKKVQLRRKRKEVSRHTARGDRHAAAEGVAVARPMDKALGRIGRKFKPRKKGGELRPEQVIPVLLKEGIRTKEQAAKARARYGDRHPDADPKTVTPPEALDEVLRRPEILEHPRIREAVEIARREQPNIETSPVKKYESVIETYGIRRPEDRYVKERNAIKRGRIVDEYDPDQLSLLPKKDQESLEDIRRKAEAETVAEAQAVVKREGLADPVYVASVDASKPRGKGVDAVPRGTVGRVSYDLGHKSDAKLNREGLEDVSYEAFQARSILEPRAKREQNRNTAEFVEQEAIPVPVKWGDKEKTSKVVTESQRNRAEREGLVPEDTVWLDAQVWKAAVTDSTTERPLVAAFEESVARATERVAGEKQAGLSKGRTYIAIDGAKAREFLAQHRGVEGKIGKAVMGSQRAASRALLGYSPSWLLAQPIAETAQALAAVGPVQMLQGLRRYKKMSPEEKRRFDAGIGGTAGTGSIAEPLTNVRGDVGLARTQVGKALRATPPGRVVHGIATGRYAHNIDRIKGLAIRRAVAAAHLEREYNGFTGALHRLTKHQDELDTKLRKMTPEERIAWVAKNPKALAKVENYVDDVMGNWTALTSNERALSAVVIFYPFVRMSMEWTALTFPARHPLKAAVMHFLAQQNAEQMENLLGGKPSFFTQWATAPLYAGRGDELGEPTGLTPLSRIAPGSNAFIEAVGEGQSPRALLRGVNPFIAAGAAAIGDYDAQTGRSKSDKYEVPSFADFARSVGSSLAKLPAPIRVADLALDRKFSRKLEGKPVTPTTMLFDLLAGDSKKRVIRSLVPFIPANTARERQETEIGRLLERKYAAEDLDFFERIRPAVIEATKGGKDPKGSEAEQLVVKYLDALVAQNQLKKIQERYGIRPAKELTGRAEAIAGSAGDLTLPGRWNEILEGASHWRPNEDAPYRKTGLSIRRLKKLRRARAREIMAGSE